MGLVSFKAGGGVLNTGYKPSSITNLTIKRSQKTAALTWTDPEDFTIDDTPCVWARTVLIRKVGSAPQSIHDGTEVAVITERNKHTETPWVDGILALDVTYYYAAYVVSTDGVISDFSNIVSITIPTTRTMTVLIDLNDSNPETCGSYTDNAIDMPYGKTEDAITAWQEFFGYRPCLFKDGEVVGYLNPNDYSKFEDGNPADITSGDAGDVMIEFPRRGVKISKSGKVITVSMTEDSDDPEFTYYAHTRGNDRREYFYLGAYDVSYNNSSGLFQSRSGVEVLAGGNNTRYYRLTFNEKGYGYDMITWHQWVYIQVMYLLQFSGNLNSQSCLGIGCHGTGGVPPTLTTGSLNKKGLIYGSTTKAEHVKLFGLEDIYSGIATLLDGIIIDPSFNMRIATDKFNDYSFTNYKKKGILPSSTLTHNGNFPAVGYIDDVIGNSDFGFFPNSLNGSSSTFFSDYAVVDRTYTKDYVFCTYSDNLRSTETGLFSMNIRYETDESDYDSLVGTTTRLSYF